MSLQHYTQFYGWFVFLCRRIILLALGVVLLDYSSQACINPCEALVSDTMSNSSNNGQGFMIYSCMLSLGSCLGYGLSSVDWNRLDSIVSLASSNIKWTELRAARLKQLKNVFNSSQIVETDSYNNPPLTLYSGGVTSQTPFKFIFVITFFSLVVTLSTSQSRGMNKKRSHAFTRVAGVALRRSSLDAEVVTNSTEKRKRRNTLSGAQIAETDPGYESSIEKSPDSPLLIDVVAEDTGDVSALTTVDLTLDGRNANTRTYSSGITSAASSSNGGTRKFFRHRVSLVPAFGSVCACDGLVDPHLKACGCINAYSNRKKRGRRICLLPFYSRRLPRCTPRRNFIRKVNPTACLWYCSLH